LRNTDIKERLKLIGENLATLRMTGVPYTDDQIKFAYEDAMTQADPDSDNKGLIERYGNKAVNRDFDGQKDRVTEMDALIAYMQMLGTLVDFKTYNPDLEIKDTKKEGAKP